MIRAAAGLVAMAVTLGCATAAAAPEEEAVPPHGSTAGKCDASKAASLVGKTRSDALGAEAMRLSGAASLRWIRPGDMVTMDYREDRLNIELDERSRVARLRCG